MKVVLVSNGTQITEKLAKNLRKVGLTQVQVTLHGANSKAHDEFVLLKGAFNRTIKAIEYLIREDIDVIVMTAAMKLSLSQIPALTDFLLEIGVKVFRLQEIIPIGRASRHDLALTLGQRRLLYRFLSLKQKELGGILSIYYAYPTCQPLSYPTHPIFERWKGCWVPGEFCIILANGTVVPCVITRSREYWAGNALEDGFLNIWRNSSVFKEFRKLHDESLRGKCVRCPYNISCGGGCRLLSERLGKKPFYPDPRCIYDPDLGVDMFEFYHGNSLGGDKSESIIG